MVCLLSCLLCVFFCYVRVSVHIPPLPPFVFVRFSIMCFVWFVCFRVCVGVFFVLCESFSSHPIPVTICVFFSSVCFKWFVWLCVCFRVFFLLACEGLSSHTLPHVLVFVLNCLLAVHVCFCGFFSIM